MNASAIGVDGDLTAPEYWLARSRKRLKVDLKGRSRT